LLLEFASVLGPSEHIDRVLEIGAGCGSAILPVLRTHPGSSAVVCDVSSTCLQQLQEAAALLGLPASRLQSFVADGCDARLGQKLAAEGCNADVALIMFTLSAVLPATMPQMLRNAWCGLRPGGVLCIRDHGLYDMVQLRIPAEQCIGRNLYRRGDGTLAYFYEPKELAGMAVAAGFEVLECEYVCVHNKNRKTGQLLKRVFVHGMFRRPVEESSN
jgi:methyltransferase-like protein 6